MTDQDRIALMLDALTEYEARLTIIRCDKQQAVDKALLPIRDELAAIEAEFGPQLEAAGEAIAELTDVIKAAVKEIGESIKGGNRHAVYTKPRTTWDNKGLEGYAIAHPEIEAFKRIGEASVSIRSVK